MKVLAAKIQACPALGWIGVCVSEVLAFFGWLINHSSQIGAIFGAGAAVLGFIAGWYTVRIQRRTWLSGESLRQPERWGWGKWRASRRDRRDRT